MFDWFLNLQWKFIKSREYPGINDYLYMLKLEENINRKLWNKIILEKVNNLVSYAKDNVPYYKEIFLNRNNIKRYFESLSDFSKLPLLSKSTLKYNSNMLISQKIKVNELIRNATGGSTGVPLVFYQDNKYLTIANAIDAHVRDWWRIKPYDKTAIIWGADREFVNLSWKEKFYQWYSRQKSMNAFKMTTDDLHNFCKMLTKWKPPYIMGYSSALETLANFVIENNYSNIRFKAIRSSAEMLWPYQRKLIESTFNSPVYNFYGSREVNNLAAECPEEHNLHLISTWRYVEIVDEDGTPKPEGEAGYIAVTDMSNYAMPFIRYLNGDMAKISNVACSCGRPSPILEELLGRSCDIIKAPNGDLIHGEFFTHLFYGVEEISQFQVHQIDKYTLIIRYVENGYIPEDFFNNLKISIKNKMGDLVNIRFEKCESIQIPSSGKHRFTISDVD